MSLSSSCEIDGRSSFFLYPPIAEGIDVCLNGAIWCLLTHQIPAVKGSIKAVLTTQQANGGLSQ
jgi:hypothetical protein